MSTDVFANFSALDELIQVIYQSIYKFVAVSTVTDDQWTIYLGLSDSAGRWWKGNWTEKDVHDILGNKPSDKLLEQFADQLVKLFVDGELSITNWNISGLQMKFTLGAAAKKPIHIPLEEMTPPQAAEFATGIFLDIALQAQSRECRLHGGNSISFQERPSSFTHARAPTSKPALEAPSFPSSTAALPASSSRLPDIPPRSGIIAPVTNVPMDISSREQASDLNKPKNKGLASKPAVAPIPRSHKGASLANPNKKARKYQAIEFESDSE